MKLILYISSAVILLVAQLCCYSVANPLPDGDDAGTEHHEVGAHNKLYTEIATEYVTKSIPHYDKYAEVYTKVIEDLKDHEEYESEKKDFEEFLEVYHKLKSSDGDVVTKLSTVLELQKKLIAAAEHYMDESQKENFVRKQLLEHGIREVAEGVRKCFEDFDEEFEKDFTSYMGELTEGQKEHHHGVQEWFDTYKTEELKVKFKKFPHFFTFFNHDLKYD